MKNVKFARNNMIYVGKSWLNVTTIGILSAPDTQVSCRDVLRERKQNYNNVSVEE